ncbi:inovirus-type Gp2 protein [Chitinibacter sp. S2-10]|uniref:YagK/YfjJ domain-containing protein n=1 Tax=Chitinibacter sp. S2-10 TaxID=3373597 RepID=UPI003977675E
MNAYNTQPTFHSNPSWTIDSQHNMDSASEYIDYLFKKARMLVVRVDLSFSYGHIAQYEAEHARDAFQRFLNNIKQTWLNNHRLGYMWAMECGDQRGFHFHCLFFYDEVERQQALTLGHGLGKYWMNNINGGYGEYYCSNRDEAVFAEAGTLGIGKIHRNDGLGRQNLLRVVSYLVKESEETKLRLPDSFRRFRTFGRGEMSNKINSHQI